MPRYKENRHAMQILFTKDEYEKLKRYAALSNQSMSEVVREFTSRGLDGELTEKNIDFLTPIIRRQLESILDAKIERLVSMTAKTCVQAGTAAYLSAESLNSFVPESLQQNFIEAYDRARKKALKYLKETGINHAEQEGEQPK